ncbi:receptor-like protein 49 [Salvia hispanica]|uniref:receptor-like protein 49 n=1 Tax=Salvia hispanica TaxID=49212 RepID=UPI002009679F|nr:receptor-like protein 49 [Salvia hispanica]
MLSNLLWYICILISSFISTTHSYNNKCFRHQEILLLQLKDELIFDSSLSTKLVRWNESGECCKWHGVECDASGHIVSLQLDDEAISGGIGDSSSLFRFEYLQKLNLAFNNLYLNYTPIPKGIGNLTYLTHLNLSYAGFGGQVPFEISSLTRLASLDISTRRGTLSLEHPNLEMLVQNLTRLEEIHVDLSFNYLTGSLPSTLFEGLSNLVRLDLSYNSFSGNIPHSLSGLPSLLELDLRKNQFNGTFQLDNFRSLPNLILLGLSDNSLSVDVGNISSSSHGCFRLKVLYLASCNLSNFPDFIKHLNLEELNLSNNSIAGEIPSWSWGTQLSYLDLSFNLLTDMQKPYHMPASLGILYLQSNQLGGELQLSIPLESELLSLSLANNSLSGLIPTSLCNATHLNTLDLSGNKLSGSMPRCPLDNIWFLDLSQNNISGEIPDIFPMKCVLQYLDLNNNNLEGKIPKSLESCHSLNYMNVGNNMMNNTFPCIVSSILGVLVLHSNRFHGEVRCHASWPNLQILDISSNQFTGGLDSFNFSSWTAMALPSDGKLGRINYNMRRSSLTLTMKGQMVDVYNIWSSFGTIDLSSNNFHGKIPNAIGDLNSLYQLNFSHNALDGSIPKSFGQLSNLESLDLSVNQLVGPIPEELGGLTFLAHLNLSYNMFVGAIPKGRQIQTFSADSFEGNLGLCGFPLDINCSNTNLPPPGFDENVEEEMEIEWEYVCAAVGYVVGVGSIVWLLLFCRSFREKYFGKIEEVVEGMFIARDMRRRRARREAAVRNRAGRH